MVLVIAFTWYMNYYISMNLLNTANYITSLVTSALKHEMETAVSIASFNDVTGAFNFTFMLPTSSFSTQGLAINYNITLYPRNESIIIELMANITVTASLGPITRTMRTTTLLYSSTQPYTIIAYNCEEGHQVTLANPSWKYQGLPSQLQSCTWNSTTIQKGNAIISISKG
ncbi:hypothetical protein [Vulcanisaeta distributa]|uniref:hypothetical protein n=1 Tax=Vulcanisaeta distributa TaxID=164451 RepID=UPI000AB90297|nr:hypothetical protein [Vulcanisaeta distributa]